MSECSPLRRVPEIPVELRCVRDHCARARWRKLDTCADCQMAEDEDGFLRREMEASSERISCPEWEDTFSKGDAEVEE